MGIDGALCCLAYLFLAPGHWGWQRSEKCPQLTHKHTFKISHTVTYMPAQAECCNRLRNIKSIRTDTEVEKKWLTLYKDLNIRCMRYHQQLKYEDRNLDWIIGKYWSQFSQARLFWRSYAVSNILPHRLHERATAAKYNRSHKKITDLSSVTQATFNRTFSHNPMCS